MIQSMLLSVLIVVGLVFAIDLVWVVLRTIFIGPRPEDTRPLWMRTADVPRLEDLVSTFLSMFFGWSVFGIIRSTEAIWLEVLGLGLVATVVGMLFQQTLNWCVRRSRGYRPRTPQGIH